MNENFFENFVDDGKFGIENMFGSKFIFCNKELNVYILFFVL